MFSCGAPAAKRAWMSLKKEERQASARAEASASVGGWLEESCAVCWRARWRTGVMEECQSRQVPMRSKRRALGRQGVGVSWEAAGGR